MSPRKKSRLRITHSSKKKRTGSRKHALGQESVHEKRTRSRKNDNGKESNQETTLSVKVVLIGRIDKSYKVVEID